MWVAAHSSALPSGTLFFSFILPILFFEWIACRACFLAVCCWLWAAKQKKIAEWKMFRRRLVAALCEFWCAAASLPATKRKMASNQTKRGRETSRCSFCCCQIQCAPVTESEQTERQYFFPQPIMSSYFSQNVKNKKKLPAKRRAIKRSSEWLH